MKIFLVVALLLTTACVSVDTRIKERSTLFASLPKAQQELVRQGKITEGMEEQAVYIALGNPDDKSRAHIENRYLQTWLYGRNSRRVVFFDQGRVVGWYGLGY